MKINKLTPCLTMEYSHNGRYVLAEELEMLVQQNKEMLEVLKECLPEVRFNYHSCVALGASEEDVLMQRKRRLIAKTESIINKAEAV